VCGFKVAQNTSKNIIQQITNMISNAIIAIKSNFGISSGELVPEVKINSINEH